jgi:pSer/pThr/pTyr-binding forkhead associated (FHA) protein
MIQCPSCGATHPNNTLYCAECGQLLESGSATSNLAAEQDAIQTGKFEPAIRANVGCETQAAGPIFLTIGRLGRQIQVSLISEIILGRTDPRTGVYPDVDLTDYDGQELGVSRRHARLLCADRLVVIEDLGSANGTFFNGRRLSPHHAQALQDGDELQLGKLKIEVHLSGDPVR